MDHQAMQREMRDAIEDSRLLREHTAAAIAQARRLCDSTHETLERRGRGRPRLRLVEDDSSDTDPERR